MISYFDYQFRIIIIGDSMVGKSSFLRTFVKGTYSTVCDPTVGVDFYSRTVRVSGDKYVRLQFWDTAGQEKFRSIAKSYYRNCVGAFIMFDITDRETYENVPSWYQEALSSIRCTSPVVVIVGHKADRQAERQVTRLEAECLAQRLGDHQYVETSSVTGQNIEKSVQMMAEVVYRNVIDGFYEELSSTGDWDGVKVSQNAALAASIANQSLRIHNAEPEPSFGAGCC
ncbi:RAB39 member RAS oncogene family [Fasciola gigantica]|uniref:RAB39 member RAS oncogene family n=1 Tax=Fasciola gigantica TaxID=46835 RepID=A0A504YES7_FASGI|nr:RAB39 member RAS oncogene family [Fasciola gigantica]